MKKNGNGPRTDTEISDLFILVLWQRFDKRLKIALKIFYQTHRHV